MQGIGHPSNLVSQFVGVPDLRANIGVRRDKLPPVGDNKPSEIGIIDKRLLVSEGSMHNDTKRHLLHAAGITGHEPTRRYTWGSILSS